MAGGKDNGRITLVMVFEELREFRLNATDRLARLEQQLSGYSDVKKTAYEAHVMAVAAQGALAERKQDQREHRKLWYGVLLTALGALIALLRDWWVAR